MRFAYWIPVALLTLMLSGIGFRYGVLRQGITETDVITLYAQRYLADHAASGRSGKAQITDCAARPSQGVWTWLVVTCQPVGADGAAVYRYEVNMLGGLIGFSGPEAAVPSAPQT